MAQDENARMVTGLYDAWNERAFDAIVDAFAPDGEILLVGSGTRFTGPEGIREYEQSWADGFPDGRVQVDNVVAAGDHVVVEFTGRGTQTATLRTPGGGDPRHRALGDPAALRRVRAARREAIQRLRTYFDSASLLTQLGVMETQPTATA